jgi:hypothetical protein
MMIGQDGLIRKWRLGVRKRRAVHIENGGPSPAVLVSMDARVPFQQRRASRFRPGMTF